jgi:hypothetical protein
MIKNYTSQVPASQSISYIERQLVIKGATNILKQYDNQELKAICFSFNVNGTNRPFRLPAKVEKIYDILMSKVRKPNNEIKKNRRTQAERTGWKIISDWIDIQMALIELEQAEIMEIFLPYLYDPASEQTFFEKIKEGGYQLLLTESNE